MCRADSESIAASLDRVRLKTFIIKLCFFKLGIQLHHTVVLKYY